MTPTMETIQIGLWLLLAVTTYFLGKTRGRIEESEKAITAKKHALIARMHVEGFGRVLDRNGFLEAGYDEVKEIMGECELEYEIRE